MTRFRVWAPQAATVEVALEHGGALLALERTAGGWWQLDAPGARHGTRYRYHLDGGPGRPDPRSAWQPEGIDGPSAVVEHDRFEWHDDAWSGADLPAAVLYECHVGTFSTAGTFRGVIEHLDHLVDLGVTALELMPVAEASGERGWGYDGVLLWAPHHAYGGPDGLKELVDACHERGLAVVGDVVYNHLGPVGNYLAEFGPYFTDAYRTPWGEAVNFDRAGSDEVRRFVVENASLWLREYHFDGLRLDAVHAIVDQSAWPILEELAWSVGRLSEQLGRRLWLIAESDRNDPRLVWPPERGGYGLDAVWSDDFHHALHALVTGERSGYYGDFGSLEQLGRSLERVYVYGRDYSPFRQRHHGRPVGEVTGDRFVAYTQNHDQVGNRAQGERLAGLVDVGSLKVAAAVLILAPFVPLLFQGEEWAASTPFLYFTDHRDPALGRAVTEGRRAEFAAFAWDPSDVPDPQAPASFERSRLDWAELGRAPHAEVLAWYRQLLALRREQPDLRDGRLEACRARVVPPGLLDLRRGCVRLVAQFGSEAITLEADGRLLLASDHSVRLGSGQLHIGPRAAAVVLG